VVQAKVPNLHNLDDIAEYVQGGGGAASDSEAEDEESRVVLPDRWVALCHCCTSVRRCSNNSWLIDKGLCCTLTLVVGDCAAKWYFK
jgi:hypothetical protein